MSELGGAGALLRRVRLVGAVFKLSPQRQDFRIGRFATGSKSLVILTHCPLCNNAVRVVVVKVESLSNQSSSIMVRAVTRCRHYAGHARAHARWRRNCYGRGFR